MSSIRNGIMIGILVAAAVTSFPIRTAAIPDVWAYSYFYNANRQYGICGRSGEGVYVYAYDHFTRWPEEENGVSFAHEKAKQWRACMDDNGLCAEGHGSALPAC